MGIDRQQIVDDFYPPGSEVATHFTPCDIPYGCVGDRWYEFDAAAAKALLAEAGYPDGFETKLELSARGPRLPARSARRRAGDPGPARGEPEHQRDPRSAGDTTYLDNADAGLLDGLHLLGWGADYPDVTNFLDYHFGAGASDAVRRQVRRHHGRARRPAPPALTTRRASRLRRGQQRDQDARADGPDGPRRRPAWPTRPTSTDAPRVAARATSSSRSMARRRPRPVRVHAERRAGWPVLRRRDRRRGAPRLRAGHGGALRLRDRRHRGRARRWPRSASRTTTRRRGPARSARASSSTTARRSTPTTSCSRTPSSGTPSIRSTGRDGSVRVLARPVRRLPQPAAAGASDRPRYAAH